MAGPLVSTLPDEAERVYAWRMMQFLALGFERHQADRLLAWHADWHDAEHLIDLDYTHEQVLQLLA